MMNQKGRKRSLLAALASATLTLSGQLGNVGRVAAMASAAAECEGTACQQVTVTFDDDKQQYNVRNNSADRWVKVSAANLAAATHACLAPGASEHLALKSIVGAYKADYAEPKCGAPDDYGIPPDWS